VWHVIGGFYDYKGTEYEMYSYMLAMDDDNDLSDRGYLKDGTYFAYSYVVNLTHPELTEYGDVILIRKNEGVVRVNPGLNSLYPPRWYNVQEMSDIGLDYHSACIDGPHIEIPKKHKEIRARAFMNREDIVSVNIADGIKKIGNAAFLNCKNLAKINIPDSVTEVEECAFDVTAWYDNQPNGVIYAGKAAYAYKGTIPENANITLRDGTVSITDSAFAHCAYSKNPVSITIPSSVVKFGERLFENCADDYRGNITIHCKKDTASHEYAIKNYINYELII
jgi:hypothetical protein